MSVARSRSSLSASADTLLSLVDSPSACGTQHLVCGGAPGASGSGSPCGLPSRTIVKESDACRLSPPCQPPPTLCRGGMGTNINILYVVSGGNHFDTSTRNPCGRARLGPGLACNACRLGPHGKSQGSSLLWCTCSNHSILYAVSGGPSLSPFHEFDGCMQTLPQPLSPPLPFTAAIHDHGHVSALLRVSVSRVNSTPQQ